MRRLLQTSNLGYIRRLSSSTSATPVPWKWVPPPSRPIRSLEEEAAGDVEESVPKKSIAKPIQLLPGVHLTAEEVIGAFQINGAENVVSKPCGRLAEAMIIATGRSSLHARMLAELVVKSTKERRLKMFNPSKPIEGDQDWFLVDTGSLLVHVFGDEETRKKIGLEEHLDEMLKRQKTRPNDVEHEDN